MFQLKNSHTQQKYNEKINYKMMNQFELILRDVLCHLKS